MSKHKHGAAEPIGRSVPPADSDPTSVAGRSNETKQRARRSGSRPAPDERSGVVAIPLTEIRVNLSNPRRQIDERELEYLAESIRQHGLLQPILVRPLSAAERQRGRRRYQIVIGSRRFHAVERAGLREIDCYVRGLSPDEAVVASFLDHAHHRTLTPAEESEFLRYLRDQRKLRLREIAALLSKSIAYVSRRLGVSENPQLDEAVLAGRINQAAAQEILRAPERWWPTLIAQAEGLTSDQVRALVNAVGDGDLTPEAVERILAGRGDAAPAPKRGRQPAADGPDSPEQSLRENGPVTRIPPSPAFALLRQVHAWSVALPADWRPSPPDGQLLNEALALIHAVIARAPGTSAQVG